jgi:ferredoxin
MADKGSKVAQNVPGSWYVDTNCINCNACVTTAPDNFEAGDEFTYVKKQPAGAEVAACEDAKAACPVEAIGDDGN